MERVSVKEGIFHTTHRSSSERERGRESGMSQHEVQFGGASHQNLKSHTLIPALGITTIPAQ